MVKNFVCFLLVPVLSPLKIHVYWLVLRIFLIVPVLTPTRLAFIGKEINENSIVKKITVKTN
jgi:hypothetical protein